MSFNKKIMAMMVVFSFSWCVSQMLNDTHLGATTQAIFMTLAIGIYLGVHQDLPKIMKSRFKGKRA